MPLYEYMVLASSLEAPRTVMRLPLFSSYSRHCSTKRRVTLVSDSAGTSTQYIRCPHELCIAVSDIGSKDVILADTQ